MPVRTEPLQAIVADADGVVTDVLVCDQATADLFAQWFPDLYPDSTWHNVTGMGVGIGWTFDAGRSPAFRPPAPGPDWTWNEDTDSWDAPPPPPDPDPPADEDPPTDPPADPDPAPVDPAPTGD